MKFVTSKLEKLIVLFDSKRVPLSSRERANKKGKYPYYGATGILDYVDDFLFDGKYILLGEDGTVQTENGKPILQLVEGKFWVSNHAHIIKNSPLIDFDFLYYLLLNTTITSIVTGAVQPKISQGNLCNLEVTYPESLNDQKKIASILKSIDEKILNNNNINNNLDEQIILIFKNKIAECENASGWLETSLDKVANYLNGLAMQKYPMIEGKEWVPVLKIAELKKGKCDTTSDRCNTNFDKKYLIQNGDVIFSWSASLVVDIWCGGLAGLNQHLFKVTSEKFDRWFYYCWTKYHLDSFIREASSKATTMGHITRDRLSLAKVLVPDDSTYKEIGGIISPMIEKIIANRLENQTLEKIRDEILPKLMDGSLEVKK